MKITFESRITSGGLSYLIDGPFKTKREAEQSAIDRWHEDETRHVHVIEVKRRVVFSRSPIE